MQRRAIREGKERESEKKRKKEVSHRSGSRSAWTPTLAPVWKLVFVPWSAPRRRHNSRETGTHRAPRYRGPTRLHCTLKKSSRPAGPTERCSRQPPQRIFFSYLLSIPLLSDRDFTIDKPALLRDRITGRTRRTGGTPEHRDQSNRVLLRRPADGGLPARTAMPPTATKLRQCSDTKTI